MQAGTEAPRYAEPTSLGLFGLAIGCAALLPLAFGVKAAFTPDALRTCALFCLLFGGGCQFLAGLMSFANKNMLGGTLLTTFSFNWIVNAWALNGAAEGKVASSAVLLSVDLCFLLIFLVMTFAFGYFSRFLLLFLLDIDLLYVLRIARELLHTSSPTLVPSINFAIAIVTVVLMFIALYIAFALVLANASGKILIPIGTPVFRAVVPGARPPSSPDATVKITGVGYP